MTVLGLCCCVSFSVVVSRGYFLAVACRHPVAVASCCRAQSLGFEGFSSCGSRAQTQCHGA